MEFVVSETQLLAEFQNCRIGKIYCKPGYVCQPEQGSFNIECGKKGCANFN